MESGRVVGGRYRIGAGGVGDVRFGQDIRSGRPVAVKMLDGAPGPAVRLRHPGIVTVLGTGEHEGRPYLAMELLDGYTLDDHLLDGGYRAAAVADFGAQIAEALAVAHRAGLTHGGIGPARLLLTPAGAVKILGFGTVAPAPGSDLSALGDTLDELLARPLPAGPPGELDALVSQLRDTRGQDPRRTEEFAARLRRLAAQPTAAEPAEPAQPPRRPAAAQRFWIHRRPGRLPLGRALVVVIVAGLIAVTAYAIAVTS
ncbi:protein kinase [Kitasatospora sp. NPDC004799]|uniref:protein kinase domain-containing protein n=1 Tax=Kitasatospora sp. NPDC004799 TaxID=3154460 RepID=UPI0033A93427